MCQQTLYLILNAIYEPSFLDSSHGSRPNKGTHTALKDIKFGFKGKIWCIEADIKNNFPSISHKILLNLLRKRISCQKFLALIKYSIKAGFVKDGKLYESNVGIFQGNVTSPILNNIYLHELDLFMLKLCNSYRKGKYRRKNLAYRKVQYELGKLGSPAEKRVKRNELWNLYSKDPHDPNFRRIYYVRYVDDFVVGIAGPRREAVNIQEQIREFLNDELKLTLSKEKTSMTHFSKDPILFLGTLIKGDWEKQKRIKTAIVKGTRMKMKVTSRVVLKAPILTIFEKATMNGLYKKRFGKFVPTGVGRLINLDHADIIAYFNSVIRGILNYYSFANNRKSLGSFVHGLKLSCARTLALKFKLRHASKVFKRFGSKLKCPNSGSELFIPNTFKAIKTFNVNEPIPDEALFLKWNNKLTRSNLFKECIICGSRDQVEMHHVRKIRDLKMKAKSHSLDFFTMQMAAINRKQVPLCKPHHRDLHNNKLSLEDRKLFNFRIKLLK